MKLRYDKIVNVYPIGYTTNNGSLLLDVKAYNIRIAKLFLEFESGQCKEVEWTRKSKLILDMRIYYALLEVLSDYDFMFTDKQNRKLIKLCQKNEKKKYFEYLKLFCR